jgi:hypothetical protein
MDLEELRGALNRAASNPLDATSARETVGTRARGLRRRRRVVASAVALVCAIAVVVSAVAVFGGEPTRRSVDIAPPGGTDYETLASRSHAALAYDDALGKVVLFGGADATLEHDHAGTWLWDGHGWSQLHPGTSPSAREGAVMSYEPTTRKLVLFGGMQRRPRADSLAFHDTWTFDGTTWTEEHPQHVPPWNSGTAMGFDPKSQSVLLLTLPLHHPNVDVTPESVALHGAAPFGTWSWDGSDWRELATPSAPLFATTAVAFHTNPRLTPLPNGAGLLFYSWAVFTGSCPVGTNGRSACEPKPDPNGTIYSQTWTWDGTGWTQQHPTRAPGRTQFVTTPGPDAAPTVFLPERGIWRWTGSDWNETMNSGIGSDGTGFAVYDTHDSEVVAYAARNTDGREYSTWTWNGSWVEHARPVAPSSTTAGSPTSTTTTVAVAPDPLPAGSVMLGVSGRTISALDAQGHVLTTLVTAFAGRTVRNAQLMPDHRTIWYATKADDNQSCPEIVKLDLQTNARTVIAHADDFSFTPDGSKLLLVWPRSAIAVTNNCQPVPYPSGVHLYDGAFVMRDLTTGHESTLPETAYPSAGTGGPTGHVWISETGEELISSNCTADGCGTLTFTVPKDLNGPIVLDKTRFGPKCGCSTLVSGPDGVYGIDEGTWNDTRNYLRRYEATNLTGTGAEIFAPKDGTLGSVAPTAAGVFVGGIPAGSTTGVLYRVANGALEVVGPLGFTIHPIPDYIAP